MGLLKAARLVNAANNLGEIQNIINSKINEQIKAELHDQIDQSVTMAQELLANETFFTGNKNDDNSVLSISKLQYTCIRVNNEQQNVALRFGEDDLIRLEVISKDCKPSQVMHYSLIQGDYVFKEDSFGCDKAFLENIKEITRFLAKERGEIAEPIAEVICIREETVSLGYIATQLPELVAV